MMKKKRERNIQRTLETKIKYKYDDEFDDAVVIGYMLLSPSTSSSFLLFFLLFLLTITCHY